MWGEVGAYVGEVGVYVGEVGAKVTVLGSETSEAILTGALCLG